MRRLNLIAFAALLSAGCADPKAPDAPPPPSTLIRNARVFDGSTVLQRADVLIRGAHIAEVGTDLAPPAGARIVDGAGKTLLPGLIDAHFHICYREQLEEAVAAGITTVLDWEATRASGGG